MGRPEVPNAWKISQRDISQGHRMRRGHALTDWRRVSKNLG
jgi:hypothetical protein